jgi:hypothetical protein
LTFERWRVDVSIKHGFLSPTAIAANFLAASDLVHRLAKGNRQLQRAIYQYADAWHWMHFEAKGEHERAAKNVRGRAKGPEAKRETANRRKAIVEGIYERFASDEKNGSVRKNAKGAADKLFIEVNEKLYEEGIRKMTKEALTKELPRLIKQRFPKRK